MTVADLNDTAPVLQSASAVTINENTSKVVDLVATDQDTTGEATVFTIKPGSGDGALFQLNGTSLEFISAPDFEYAGHGPSYTVTVVASDGVNSSEQTITVTVADVKAGDTRLGTVGADSFVYSPDLTYDRIDGLGGSDTLTVSAASIRLGASGSDLAVDVGANGSTDLSAANIEHLVLTGAVSFAGSLAGTALAGGEVTINGSGLADVIDGTLAGVRLVELGGGGNDSLTGGAAGDWLDGASGSDTLTGGLGDDTYVVDSSGDKLVELAGQGIDTVRTSLASYTLATNFEALVYTGSGAFTGYGNAADNTLLGGAGNDKLDGKAGADTLVGGLGDDTYTVDNAGDVVIEQVGAGTDTVKATVSYTLGANVEKLTLGGTAAIDGTGNELGNTIKGNDAANALFGLAGKDSLTGGGGNDILSGGLGADTLTGGTGADSFRFDVLETTANKDTITDFAPGIDRIELDHTAFAAFSGHALGAIGAGELALGAAASTASQHLVYNGATGALYYDADGAGGQTQVQIAVFTASPGLTASDLVLI